jgi:hypothetical protein
MARMLLVMGIAAEIYVVTRVEMHSYVISIACATTMLVVGCTLWFLLPVYSKYRRRFPPNR